MTTDTDHSQVKLDVPEGTQSLEITRDFNASPDKVFRAHMDPELFVKWNGPEEITNTIREWDPKTGGNWSYVSRDDNGEYADAEHGEDDERVRADSPRDDEF